MLLLWQHYSTFAMSFLYLNTATISLQVYVESFKNRLTMEERLERIESFDYLPILGPVRMSDPDVVYSNFEFWGMDANRLPKAPYRLVNATDLIKRVLD